MQLVIIGHILSLDNLYLNSPIDEVDLRLAGKLFHRRKVLGKKELL